MTRTLVLVHAHPDDESIWTGGTIARYAAAGVRVVVVTCTAGERGEIIPAELRGLAADRADQLGGYRVAELEAACGALGVSEQRFLGGLGRWRDSGMVGEPGGRARAPGDLDPRSLVAGPRAEQTEQLVALLSELAPQVVVTYGPDGGYGHPDHIRAHEITMAATRRVAAVQRVVWTVQARSAIDAGLAELRTAPGLPFALPGPAGLPAVEDGQASIVIDITTALPAKIAALRAHRSQIELWQAGGHRALALTDGVARPLPGVEHYMPAAGPARPASELFGAQ